MESSNAAVAAAVPAKVEAGINVRKLFVLCCLCLATTSMSFALRASIAGDLKTQLFDAIDPLRSATMVGDVLSYAFLGFAFWVFLGSAVVDSIGMRNMLGLCGLSFIVGPLLVISADKLAAGTGAATVVGIGMFINGFGWGCSETVINPLTTSIYPGDKVHRLNVLHAWWPFGMVVGGLIGGFAGKQLGWRVEFALLLVPALAILALCVGTQFPKTERVAAGVTSKEMYKEALRPGFIVWFLAMFLTASSELAPGQWVDLALSNTVHMRGILLQVYVAGLMFVMRHFAGTMVHKLSSVGLLWASCLLASIGLFALSNANSPVTGILTATIWGTGVCYMWPTMLASVSERYPKGGAFLMGLVGSAGSLAIYFVLPRMGHIFDDAKIAAAGGEDKYKALSEAARTAIDSAAAAQSFRAVAILPAILLVVFGLIWLNDRRKGGFKPEQI
ncbi:MAG TPA: MFS transporter [Polyangia bacterium]|jgi:MFS family permease|nr:MFS transporter [Polyangia bacterium]HVZ21737.1 MFS transporter [Vicinamibacterales bacterium]